MRDLNSTTQCLRPAGTGEYTARMDLSEIRLGPSASSPDSLPACLEAVLRGSGAAVDYRSLHAALGLPFWIAAPREPNSQRCLGSWMSAGHDALLIEASRLFGMRLRELHPPEAAVGLEESPEFLQHFEASYRPLMELALEHGQAVLVRRGWPDDGGNLWGIVTARCDGNLGFAGLAPGQGDNPEPLTLPPVQVYIVEGIRPRAVSPEELSRHVREAARRVQHNQLDPRFGIVTGPAAYDAWLARLSQSRLCPQCGQGGAACHARMAGSVRQARRTAAVIAGHLEALKVACTDAVRALERSCDDRWVEGVHRNPRGRSEIVEDLERARRADVEARVELDRSCAEI